MMRVLLVEDDDDLRSLYLFGLEFAGFEVLEARGGFEALQKVECRRPDLVILDSTLRDIDAGSIRAELANDPRTSDIPVMLLTTTVGAATQRIDTCWVVAKPLAAWRLLDAVRKCLRESRPNEPR
jgi:DNA-binding response OmpR family regulator